MPSQYNARCFGLDWRSDVELQHFDPSGGASAGGAISVKRVDRLERRELLYQVQRAQTDADGFRFTWNDEAIFDFRGRNLRWLSGEGWKGSFPASFYSSVAAMTAASVGMLPLHMSSIVFDEKAWLIGGKAGAGKSTLLADLLSAGGQLLADDLTILAPVRGVPMATRGRPSIRLHPQSAAFVGASKVEAVPEDRRGKLLVWPDSRAEDKLWPIGGALLIGGLEEQSISEPKKAAALGSLLFRPRILAKLPGHAGRRRMVLELAQHVPAIRFRTVEHFSDADRMARIEAALQAIKAMSAAT